MSDIQDSIVSFSSDVSDAEAPPPLPRGRYKGVIRKAIQKVSQNNTKYAEILFFIGPDQYPADYTDGNPEGTSIAFRRVSLEDNPQSRWRLKTFCINIGAEIPTRELDLMSWVNREADVEISHEEYEGVNRANIARVLAA
jgi:hypothetical protein